MGGENSTVCGCVCERLRFIVHTTTGAYVINRSRAVNSTHLKVAF